MKDKRIIESLRRELSKNKKTLFAYLFGSFAKFPRYAKDIDVAVFIKGKIPSDFEKTFFFSL